MITFFVPAPGLANGVLLRTEVDPVTGQLSDTRQRFLGTRPPKLCSAAVRGNRAMLALSSRPWLGYSDMGRYNLVPLSYEALDHASSALLSLLPAHLCLLPFGAACCWQLHPAMIVLRLGL